jgi:hypothetical protein
MGIGRSRLRNPSDHRNEFWVKLLFVVVLCLSEIDLICLVFPFNSLSMKLHFDRCVDFRTTTVNLAVAPNSV